MVGRDPQLAVLTDLLATAERGTPSFASLLGQPGIGIRRLLDHCCERRLELVELLAWNEPGAAFYDGELRDGRRPVASAHIADIDRDLVCDARVEGMIDAGIALPLERDHRLM